MTPEIRNGAHITIENIRALFPEAEYKTYNQVVFKNSKGNERILKISKEERIAQKTEHGISYTYDVATYFLMEDKDPSYLIEINMAANITSTMDVVEGMTIRLRSITDPWILGTLLGITLEEIGVFNKINEMQLLDKTFSPVYFNPSDPNQKAWSVVYFTPKVGIVGFYDGTGDLWVYDRME
jgi:hypothetical protein